VGFVKVRYFECDIWDCKLSKISNLSVLVWNGDSEAWRLKNSFLPCLVLCFIFEYNIGRNIDVEGHEDELNAAWIAWNESGEVIKIEGLR